MTDERDEKITELYDGELPADPDLAPHADDAGDDDEEVER